MATLDQLKRIRDMAINKMDEIIRLEEIKLEAKKDFALENKEEKATEAAEVVKEVGQVSLEPKSTRARRGEMSALIRECFKKNQGIKNSEVIEYMRKVHNLDVKPSLVSTVKIDMSKARRKMRKKPELAKKRVRKAKSGLPMVACVTRVLAKPKAKHGAKAEAILEGVKKLGYVYSGNKGEAGFLNCVYQALHDLSKEKIRGDWKGLTPILIHNKEDHTWRLNPKAERKSA